MKKFKILRIISTVFLILALLSIVGLTWIILTNRSKFSQLYSACGMSLPKLTMIFLSIPAWVYLIISIFAIIFLIAKEWLPNKLITLLINIVTLFIVGFYTSLYIRVLFLPLFKLQQLIKN